MKRPGMGNRPGRADLRMQDWFKDRQSPMDDCFTIVKVAPGVYELAAGPSFRTPIAVIRKKPQTQSQSTLNTSRSHPQKFPSR